MKYIKTYLVIWVAAMLVFRCVPRQFQPLGYFEVSPFTKPVDYKISGKLQVFLGADVRDAFVVSGSNIKVMPVSHFRRSLEDAVVKTFSKNFDSIEFVDSKPQSGLALCIYRFEPRWAIRGTEQNTNAYNYGNDPGLAVPITTTANYFSSVYQFDCTLYLNGEKIKQADGIGVSPETSTGYNAAHPIFKSGMKVACEQLYRQLELDEKSMVAIVGSK